MRSFTHPKNIFRWFILTLVVVLLVITFLFFGTFDNTAPTDQAEPTFEPNEWREVEPEPLGDEYYAGWSEYEHEQFSIFYPSQWTAQVMRLETVEYREYEDRSEEVTHTIEFQLLPNDDLLTIDEYVRSGNNEILEQYPVKINDQTFQHYLYRNQGNYFLAWYIMNDADDIMEMKTSFGTDEDKARGGDWREEILTLFTTFPLKQ